MGKPIKIANRTVGEGGPTFVVAEISGNHNQDFKKAVALVKAAKRAGADAVKFQTYTADTMTIDCDNKWFQVGGKRNPRSWKNRTFYDLYKKAYTPWAWFPRLQKLAHKLGLVFFSTPFDETAVNFLERLKVPCYKIAAYESLDLPLLRAVGKTGQPVIVSVGFSTLKEVRFTIDTLRKHGAKEIIVLQCTASYAKTPNMDKTNLRTMLDIKRRFGVEVGLSDNMGGIEVPVLATALGASVIEKHLVLNHKGSALDDRFSLDEREFKEMVERIRRQEKIAGKVSYGPQTPEEKYNKNFRRSLFAVRDIKAGEAFTKRNVRSIRPGYGLPPSQYDTLLRKRARANIKRGTPLSIKLIK